MDTSELALQCIFFFSSFFFRRKAPSLLSCKILSPRYTQAVIHVQIGSHNVASMSLLRDCIIGAKPELIHCRGAFLSFEAFFFSSASCLAGTS